MRYARADIDMKRQALEQVFPDVGAVGKRQNDRRSRRRPAGLAQQPVRDSYVEWRRRKAAQLRLFATLLHISARCTLSPVMLSSTLLDDWGPETLTPDQARDLLEIVEDRYDAGALIITSQIPVDRWHDMIGVPTLADAILDRVIHNAYRIELSGESLRKRSSSP